MTVIDTIIRLCEVLKERGNVELAVGTRDSDIYGNYDKNLRFEYCDNALAQNTVVL